MKIGLIGTFDVENFGDCLFPELYAHLLAVHHPNAEVTLYSPTPNSAKILSYDGVKALPAYVDQTDSFDEDVLLLIGGETVGVGHSAGTFNFPRTTLSAYLRLWMTPILAQLDKRSRPKFFGAHCVGAIKMNAEVNELVARALAAAKFCSFRDVFSSEWIKTDQIQFNREIDPMFQIDQLCDDCTWQGLAARNMPQQMQDNRYLVAQLSLGYGGNNLDAWCDAVARIHQKTSMPVILLPICHFLGDEKLLEVALQRLSSTVKDCHLVRGQINVKETAALIGRSAGYIGSSLHGAVTAVSVGKPLAVLGHSMDGKHEGTMKAVGIHGAVTTTPQGLVECFERTSSMDAQATRANAQMAAEVSFRSLLDALANDKQTTPQISAEALNAARSLRKYEAERVRFGSAAETKRLILRTLHSVPAFSEAYSARRIRKKLRSATDGA